MRDLIDVFHPAAMRVDGVGRETNELDTAFGELWLKLCKRTEFGCANWCVVFWVREQDNPFVANELMEVDWARGSLCLEIGRNSAETKAVDLSIILKTD